MTTFPWNTLSLGLTGEVIGVGNVAGSGVEAPMISRFSADRIGASGAERRISGSGSVYGRSSIRRPSFKQSSNLRNQQSAAHTN